MLGQEVRAAISPSEQVGAHSDGAGGCLELFASGGIAEGVAPLTGGAGGLVTHALRLSVAASSSINRLSES